jgi:hypothetical protein
MKDSSLNIQTNLSLLLLLLLLCTVLSKSAVDHRCD